MVIAKDLGTVPPSSALAGVGSVNQILDALPVSEREAIEARSALRTVNAGRLLIDVDRRVPHVFFPLTAIVSMLTTLRDGSNIETATIGREGMVGVFVFLGDDRIPNGRAVVQLRGTILALPVDDFRAALGDDGKLRQLMLVYTRALMLQFAQGVACNAAHPVRERLARWLLQTSDRIAADRVELTHEFLAEILGVRRASITDALRELRGLGVVDARRGGITILDRDGMVGAACECYATVRECYARLVPGEEDQSSGSGGSSRRLAM